MSSNELFIEGHKLPKPLSKEEVYELLEKINQGDNDSRDKLIHHNIRLVLHEVTGKFRTVDYDKKDLVSIGNIGLLKAINSFDISKNVEFATYATRCIDNEILMYLRKIKKHQNIDSLDRTINQDKDGNEMKLEDTLSDDTDIVEDYTNNETHAIIRELVEKLPDRDKEIIMLHFGFLDNKIYTQREIADKLLISQSYVSRLINKIVKKIGNQLQLKGLIELREDQKGNKKIAKKEGENKMAKELQTIYEYFKNYSKEEVDLMLTKLTEEEKELITLRYGEDLNSPISGKLTKEQTNKFYGCLIPKMKRLLANPNKIRKPREKRNITQSIEKPKNNESKVYETNNPVIKNSILKEENSSNEEKITKQDYIKILELLRSTNVEKVVATDSPKENMIVLLKLGYIDGKCFSAKEISEFLGIEIQEVINVTKKALLSYKEQINNVIDETIRIAIEEATISSNSVQKNLKK